MLEQVIVAAAMAVLLAGKPTPRDFLAVDAQGNVYAVDRYNNRIQKISPNGEPLAQWGTNGSGPISPFSCASSRF